MDTGVTNTATSHTGGVAGATKRIGRVVAVFAAFAVVASIAFTTNSVGAQDIESLRDRANALANKLDDLQEEASIADEDYNSTLDALEKLGADISSTKASVAEAQVRVDAADEQASAFLVTSYMEAGSTKAITAAGTSNLNETLNQQMLLDTLRGDREQLADELAASRADLDDRQSELEDQQAEMADLEVQRKEARDQVEAAVSTQQSLYNEANSELKAALAAEQARREAEAVRRAAEAQAKADAEAAAQAAATPAPTQSSSGNSSSSSSNSSSSGNSGSAGASAPAPPASAPSAPSAPPPTPGAGGAVAAAMSQLGNPYLWAGSSPSTGFDCSGLTSWAWAQAGKYIPRSSRAQYSATQRVSLSSLQPGDLVFFGSPIHHVGMYIGGGSMVHSPRTGDVVKVSSIYYMRNVVGGGRVN